MVFILHCYVAIIENKKESIQYWYTFCFLFSLFFLSLRCPKYVHTHFISRANFMLHEKIEEELARQNKNRAINCHKCSYHSQFRTWLFRSSVFFSSKQMGIGISIIRDTPLVTKWIASLAFNCGDLGSIPISLMWWTK